MTAPLPPSQRFVRAAPPPRDTLPAAAPRRTKTDSPASHKPSKPAAPPALSKEGDRLAKRVAELQNCSRREAEQYIEGGFVTVDGVVAEVPAHRITQQAVVIAKNATLAPVEPVTLLLHKPPGYDAMDGHKLALALLTLANKFAADRSGTRPITKHFLLQECVTPLETGASGLLVFTQDFRIRRKLLEDAARVEHEVMVDVQGQVSPEALDYLNRTPVVDGRAMVPAKVSISYDNSEDIMDNPNRKPMTGLRFAVKGCHPGQIAQMCESVGLRVASMKRIRVGRIQLTGLPLGQWRYLLGYERF